nr:immunoglobulin heavy chain junction region [Mus musculus]
CARSSNWDYW